MRTGFTRAASAIAVIAHLLSSTTAYAADASTLIGGYSAAGRVVQLGVGKSYVVTLPDDAAEVLVADPKIANAVVRSSRKAYIIGVAIGETDIIFFDAAGNQIQSLAVSVGRDLSPIRNNLRSTMPDSNVRAEAVGESVMLSGSVRSAAEAQTAVDVAANLVGSPDKVVNALKVEGRDQVLLKVTVAEVQRNALKQLGIKLDLEGAGKTSVGFGSNPSFSLDGTSPGAVFQEQAGASIANPGRNFDGNGLAVLRQFSSAALLANIEAFERTGLFKTLAEPTLTAISGERAEFLAGGEFPVPIAQDDDTVSVEFKKFGVGVNFTPVVLSDGRISMQIGTEVSEINNEYSVRTGTILIPGLSVRRTSTTVELASGGSIAIAGLLRDDYRQVYEGLPGLMNLPVLGTLFRSRDYRKGQSELVVIVTPYMARQTHSTKLARPDDGLITPTDAQATFLGRVNDTYAPGFARKVDAKSYRGPVGYIVE